MRRPTVPPDAPTAPHAPSALFRSAPSGKLVIRIESAAGVIAAAPTPCSARAATRAPSDQASPASSEARANNPTPAMKTRRRPSRSAARPPSRSRPPKVRAYALTTHCRFVAEKPRSVWIDGRATFTIATSRMTMKNAVQRTARPSQRRAWCCACDVSPSLPALGVRLDAGHQPGSGFGRPKCATAVLRVPHGSVPSCVL